MVSPFDQLRDELDLSVRSVTDNAFRLSTTDPQAPQKWLGFVEQETGALDQVTGAPTGSGLRSFFDQTVGRAIGATGRGALGTGRFAGEQAGDLVGGIGRSFGPAETQLAAELGQAVTESPAFQALDVAGRTGGSIAAENLAPLGGGIEQIANILTAPQTPQGVTEAANRQTQFGEFVENLARQREGASLLGTALLQPGRTAFDETEFDPIIRLLLEVGGDPLLLAAPSAIPLIGFGRAGTSAVTRRVANEAAEAAFRASRGPAEEATRRAAEQAARAADTTTLGVIPSRGTGSLDISPIGRADAAFDEPLEGLRFDPTTNTYNGDSLTRGDILVDDAGRQLQVERASGFTIEAQVLDDAGVVKPGEFVSFNVDDFPNNERFLNVRRTGRNAFDESPTSGQATLEGGVVPARTEQDIIDARTTQSGFDLTATGEDAPLRQVDDATRGAGDVVPRGQIEFVENFPLNETARTSMDAEVDDVAQQLLSNSGIRKIQVDPPYTFELSQQAGVSANGVVRVNPTVTNVRQSVLHEAGHVLWERASTAERAQLRGLVADNLALLRENSPGYVRQFESGDDVEAVAQIFAQIHELPEQARRDLLGFQPTGKSFDEAFPAIDHVEEARSIAPKTGSVDVIPVRSWDEIKSNSYSQITDQDDIAAIVRLHGDRMVVVKDINGGRSVLPASQAARLLDDPMGSGFVRQVFLPSGDIPLGPAIPDDHTLSYLPEFKQALERATAELPAAPAQQALTPPTTPATGRAAAARKVDGSELATFLRHYQDSIYGVRLHFEGLGGKIKGTTVLDEITSFYTPRNAETGTNLYTEAEKINAGLGVPGRKGRQFKERSFSNESLAEMIERGDYKLAGPMETMREHIRSTYKAGLDLEMKKYMQAAAKEPNTGLIDMVSRKARVRGAMARIRQGKVLQSGERSKVTEKTIKLIENEFPAVGRKLRDAQEIDAPVKRGKAIDDIVKTFDQDVLELNKQYFVPASGAADVAAGVRKEDRIPAYAGILFESKADADRVVEIHGLKDKGMFASIAEWSAQASDLLRVGRTGFDFGVWMIQGLPALGLAAAKSVSPGMAVEATETTAGVTNRAVGRQMLRAWGKSVPVAFKAFTDENYMLKILMQDTDLLTEAAGYGLQFSRSATDVFQAIQRGTILRKGGTAGKRIDELITKAAKPFERAFVAPGDFIRLQYYKALRPSAALKGEDGLRELAAVLNNMTGALSSSALGITPSLQRIERGFLFYSPRYTRASMALLADVFKGNVQGRIARESLIGLLGLGVSSYIVTVQAMRAAGSKQELHLDPSSSKFMTIDIGGDNIGVGGFWTQFAKVVTRVAETAWDADAREMFFDPQGGTDVVRNNPLIRWIRSRSAPFPGIGWDIAAGEDFLGRQIESPIDWAKHTQAQTTPIWFESAFLTGPYTSGLSGTVSEVVGARTRPLSSSERRRNLRNSLAVEAYDMTWEDLNGLQRDRINEGTAPGVGQSSVSDLAQLNERVLSERADKGEEKDIIIEKYHRKHRDIENKWQEHVQDGIDFLDAGAIDLRQFRDIYLTASNAIRRDAWEALSDPDGDFALAIEHFEENAKKFGEDNPEDVAYNEYITAIIGTDAFDDPEGFDFRRRDEAVLAFRNKWGDEVFAYVQGRFAEGRAMPKIVSEFYQGRQRFEYYWRDVEEATLASVPMSDSVAASYQEWLEGTANEKFELEETAPGLKRFLKKMSSVRVSLRERDRLLDAWLFRWGYTDTFRHPDNEFSPDGAEARDYWRNSMPFPLETFGIQSGVAL